MLGLGDYKYNLYDYPDSCPEEEKSLYSYADSGEQEACHSRTITVRDLEDLHAIYHPDELVDLVVGRDTNSGEWLIRGRMPYDAGRLQGPPNGQIRVYDYEYNADWIVVWSRAASLKSYAYLGSVDIKGEALAGGRARINFNDMICGDDDTCERNYDAKGKGFVVAGVTRGDWKRDQSLPVWTAHSEVVVPGLGSTPFTLGDPVTVFGPGHVPPAPSALTLAGSGVGVTEAPGAGRSVVVRAMLDRAAVGSAATVRFTVTGRNGAAGGDYVVSPAGLVVTVPVGQSAAALTVTAVNDAVIDAGESLGISASATGGGIEGTLTSSTLPVAIADNDFAVAIGGVSACAAGESVSLSASAPSAVSPVRFSWSGAASGVGSPIAFKCPAAGSHTVSVVATDSAKGTGRDTHTLIVADKPPTSLSGRVAISRMPPTSVGGHTLNLSYVTADGSRILPALRFLPFADLETTWQYTSIVRAPVSGKTQDLGRIAYRKTTAGGDRIEIAFLPTGGSLVLPSPKRFINYSAMTRYTWYTSSSFAFTLSAAASSLSDDAASLAGRLAHALAAGEEICEECFGAEADLEP